MDATSTTLLYSVNYSMYGYTHRGYAGAAYCMVIHL